jgi:hypothetical protein
MEGQPPVLARFSGGDRWQFDGKGKFAPLGHSDTVRTDKSICTCGK